MGQPVLLQESFAGGFKRDIPRDRLPRDACYGLADFLPDVAAGLRKRGGWANAVSGPGTLATNVTKIGWAPFVGTAPQLCAFLADGTLYDVTNAANRGAIGAGAAFSSRCFFNDFLISADYTNPLKKYNGATISDLTGSPSAPRVVAPYKGFLLCANSVSAGRQRIYISGANNQDSWTIGSRYSDATGPVDGLAPVRSGVIVFHVSSCELLTGDIPPGTTGDDFGIKPLFGDVGLYSTEAFAIADEAVVWADANGVYMSDGAALTDLTYEGGIKRYWETTISSPSAIAVGVWRGFAWVSILTTDADGVTNVTLVCDIRRRSWFRISNVAATNFAIRPDEPDELYFGTVSSNRIGRMSTIFEPSSTYVTDGDTTAVVPILETAWFQNGKGRNRWRRAYLSYLLDAVAGRTVNLSFATTPEGAYTSAGTLALSTSTVRERLPIARASDGLALKLTLSGSANDFRLHSLEAERLVSEQSR